ncbi:MAG: carbohydrate ABC transporter permease [Tepidisphaeraceae bacterium]
MPIIARVGRRKLSTRLLLAAMYIALTAGALSMLYPFLLMLATSTTSEPDVREFRLIPRFWYDRTALYRRFLHEKYQSITDFNSTRTTEVRAWSQIDLPDIAPDLAAARVEPWWRFVASLQPQEFALWHVGKRSMPGKVEMLWRDYLRRRYKTPQDVGRSFGREINAFTEAFAPYERPQGRLWPGVGGVEGERWDAFKATLDPKYRRPIDGTDLWRTYLRFKYERVEDLNRAAGTSHASFADVQLPSRRPAAALAGDWEHWVRNELGYRFVGIDDGAETYRRHLLTSIGRLTDINARLGTSYPDEKSIVWPPAHPTAAELDAISGFLRAVPRGEQLSVRTPDLRYAEQVAAADGAAALGAGDASGNVVRPPYEEEDLVTFTADAGSWRWWALTRNFGEVIDYIAVRGRSLWNTVFLVGTMILAAVTVNPLAAYALSRFRLSRTDQILTFLLATMAFPGEVTMIPNFLLLRQFPLWSWLGGFVAAGCVAWLLLRSASRSRRDESGRLPSAFGSAILLLAAFAAGVYLTPLIGRAIGVDLGPVSLLNSFPALILPRLANGYSIFLLKGFFDSLPEEIFEAARIDGAGEARMLWQIAFPMSTPILAVVVLFTFTAVYGSYLWALVVCQDDSMWTIMVHVFQLQQWAPQYVTMAAAVLCSIPTLLVFVLAQNVIMRGIVIPGQK